MTKGPVLLTNFLLLSWCILPSLLQQEVIFYISLVIISTIPTTMLEMCFDLHKRVRPFLWNKVKQKFRFCDSVSIISSVRSSADPHAELEAHMRKHWTVGVGLTNGVRNCLVLLLKLFLQEAVIVAFTTGCYFYKWDGALPDHNICFSILFYFLQIWKAVWFRILNSISADSSVLCSLMNINSYLNALSLYITPANI